MRVVRFQASFQCTRCRWPVPVARLASHYDCDTCGHHMDLPPTFWARKLQKRVVGILTGEAESGSWTDIDYDTTGVFDLAVEEPSCRRCEIAFQGWAPGHSVPCGRCGLQHKLRGPDPVVAAIHAGITAVLGEVDAPTAAHDKPLTCGQCHARLASDESTRVLTCHGCGALTWVSDRHWRAHRAANVRVPIYLVVNDAVPQPVQQFDSPPDTPSLPPVAQSGPRFAVAARMSFDCTECRCPVPVGAISPEVPCRTCGYRVPVDWISWFILIGRHVASVV